MSDNNFFSFPLSGDATGGEDDAEYDALNGETFGDTLNTNWEENHQKLTSELETDIDYENNKLSERMASFILDDEGEDTEYTKCQKPTQKPTQPSFSDLGAGETNNSTRPSQNKWSFTQSWNSDISTGENNSMETPVVEVPSPGLPRRILKRDIPNRRVNVTEVLTVQQIEKNMRIQARLKADCGRSKTNVPTENLNVDKPAIKNVVNRPPPQRVQNEPPYDYYQPRFRPPIIEMRNFPQRGNFSQPPMMRPHGLPQHLRHPGFSNERMAYESQLNYQRPRRPPPHMEAPLDHRPPMRLYNPHSNGRPSFTTVYNHMPRGYPLPNTTRTHQQDDYAGLMTAQEKQWLCSIQHMQLNANNPLQDDYYYSMYNNRYSGNKEKNMGNYNPKSANASKTPYSPMQFENSLGKVQVGSVTAPRKIIDMDIVDTTNLDAANKQNEKKSKQLLLEIEEMLMAIIRIEEASNPMFVNTQDGAAKEVVDVATLQEKLTNELLSENKWIPIMSIKKGKKLVLRLISGILNPATIIKKLLMDPVPIIRKDFDQLLLTFLPAIRNYLSTVTLSTLVEIIEQYDSMFLLSNKFTTSVMANMIERAEQVFRETSDKQVQDMWRKQLIRLAKATPHWSETDRPVVAVDRQVLSQHLTLIQTEEDINPSHINGLLRALGSLRPITASPTTST